RRVARDPGARQSEPSLLRPRRRARWRMRGAAAGLLPGAAAPGCTEPRGRNEPDPHDERARRRHGARVTETLGGWQRPGAGPTRQTDELALKDALRRHLARLYEEAARLEGALDERLGGGLPRFSASLRSGLPAGILLGFVAASGSLLLHVIGSLLMGSHPLQI